MRCLLALLLSVLALPAAAREFQHLPAVAEAEGFAAVGAEVERLVQEGRNPTTARAFLRKAALSELRFPVTVVGLPAAWFQVLSPVRDLAYLDSGLRGQVGVYPAQTVVLERLAATCVDAAGQPVAAPLTLSGPDQTGADTGAAVYGVDGLLACWSAGGASVLIHEAIADPRALVNDGALPTLLADDGAFRTRATEQAAAQLSKLRRFSPALDEDPEEEP